MIKSGLLLAAALAIIAAAARADDPFGADWPQGPGRTLTGALCGSCHSLAIVKQQRLKREDWDELLDWMVAEQGMGDIADSQRQQVLDYLAANFGLPQKP